MANATAYFGHGSVSLWQTFLAVLNQKSRIADEAGAVAGSIMAFQSLRQGVRAPMNIEVDLTNCDREPIHIPGSVQPFGFLLALLPNFTISIASESVKQHLGIAAGELLQCPRRRHPAGVGGLSRSASVIDFLRARTLSERMFGVPLMPDGPPFDLAVHFSGVYFVIEAEPSIVEPGVNSGELVRLMLARIRKTRTTTELAQEAARQLRVLTGFDRVMVYQFPFRTALARYSPKPRLPASSSSLACTTRLRTFRSRRGMLYQRNWLRIIADINNKLARALQSSPDALPIRLTCR